MLIQQKKTLIMLCGIIATFLMAIGSVSAAPPNVPYLVNINGNNFALFDCLPGACATINGDQLDLWVGDDGTNGPKVYQLSEATDILAHGYPTDWNTTGGTIISTCEASYSGIYGTAGDWYWNRPFDENGFYAAKAFGPVIQGHGNNYGLYLRVIDQEVGFDSQVFVMSAAEAANWHVYRTEASNNVVTLYVDNVQVAQTTAPRSFDGMGRELWVDTQINRGNPPERVIIAPSNNQSARASFKNCSASRT